MPVGRVLTPSDINTAIGNHAQAFILLMTQAQAIETTLGLAQYADAALKAAPYNFSDADVTLLRGYLADVLQLMGIATGQAALAQAKDFRANALQVAGWAGPV